MRLPRLLVLSIIMPALAVAVVVGGLSTLVASSSLEEAAGEKLEAVRTSRQAALQDWFRTIRQELRVQVENPATHEAIKAFDAAWQELGPGAGAELRRLYVTDNPHPKGEKHKLDVAEGDSAYNETHRMYHPFFRSFLDERGYYDLFLFDPQGRLIYSVFKEPDFATDLAGGRYASSGLGQAFRAARSATDPRAQTFIDFAPYAPSNDAPASFIAQPVWEDGRLIGVLALQMPIGRLNAVMQETTGLGETGQTFVVGTDSLMRNDSRFSENSTILAKRIEDARTSAALRGETGLSRSEGYLGEPAIASYGPVDLLDVRWAVVAEQSSAEALAAARTLTWQIAGTTVVILALALVIGLLIARMMSRPLVRITGAMEELAGGNVDYEAPEAGRIVEINDMAAALAVFRENKIAADAAAERERAEERRRTERAQRIEELTRQFETASTKALESVADSTRALDGTAKALAGTAEETSEQATGVAAAAQQALQNVQTVATASDELAVSIQEIGKQVAHSNEITSRASGQADQVDTQMQSLAAASNRIGEVVGLINDVAEQTNLLALNATIEAARAGDAGKGFAVVASEVKTLAAQTAKATQDISQQIAEVQQTTGRVVDSIKDIVTIIREINVVTSSVASAVDEQSAATQEIARNVDQAAQGVSEVTRNIDMVSDAASETGGSSSNVLTAVQRLDEESGSLRSGISNFINRVKAA